MRADPNLIPVAGGSDSERLQNWVNHLQQLADFSKAETVEALTNDRTPEGCLKWLHKVTDVEDQNLDDILKPLDQLPEEQRAKMLPACKAGCAHCCHQAVRADVPEVIALHEHIVKNCDQETIDLYKERARQYQKDYSSREPGSRVNVPCPMLIDDKCSAYEARPIICRGFTSLSAKRCEEWRFDKYDALKVRVPVIDPLFKVSYTLRHGVYSGLSATELPQHDVVLGLALNIVLNEPDAVDRYFAGEDAFDSARPE